MRQILHPIGWLTLCGLTECIIELNQNTTIISCVSYHAHTVWLTSHSHQQRVCWTQTYSTPECAKHCEIQKVGVGTCTVLGNICVCVCVCVRAHAHAHALHYANHIVHQCRAISVIILPYRITTRSHCILSLWDTFLWITVSSFLKFYYLLVTWWWPDDKGWNMLSP